MTHRIVSVKAIENCVLLVEFQNGVGKTYDMRTLYPMFPQFEIFEVNSRLFHQVQVDVGGYGISWNDELDLDAEDIWVEGIEVSRREVDVVYLLAENLAEAREMVGMTQKQLSDSTGIHQSDISKIERGLANPSLSTLRRLAEGMGLKLRIDFKK